MRISGRRDRWDVACYQINEYECDRKVIEVPSSVSGADYVQTYSCKRDVGGRANQVVHLLEVRCYRGCKLLQTISGMSYVRR